MQRTCESLRLFVQKLGSSSLRYNLVRPRDADYIFRLRSNPLYNAYLSDPPSSSELQALWIEEYIKREEKLQEIYLTVSNTNGLNCGTIRIYNIKEEVFCWGSWILDENKTRYAAVETALAVYAIGFDYLGLVRSEFDVRLRNERVIAFHQRMGATEIGARLRQYLHAHHKAGGRFVQRANPC